MAKILYDILNVAVLLPNTAADAFMRLKKKNKLTRTDSKACKNAAKKACSCERALKETFSKNMCKCISLLLCSHER